MSAKPSKWSIVAGGAVAAVAMATLAGCGSAGVAEPVAAEASSASTQPAATTEPTIAAPTTTTATATTTVAPVAPVSAAAAVPAVAAVMPNVVCMNLQAAQDTIQEAGVFFSRSADATGAGRKQVLDANWVVVGQTPSAGSPVGEAEAVLSAVKIGEPSPC